MKIGTPTQRDDTVCAACRRRRCRAPVVLHRARLSLDRAADALLIASLLPAMRSAEPLVSRRPGVAAIAPLARHCARHLPVVPHAEHRVRRLPARGGRGRAATGAATRRGPRRRRLLHCRGRLLLHRAAGIVTEIDALVYVRGFDVALDDALNRADRARRCAVGGAPSSACRSSSSPPTSARSPIVTRARDHYHGAGARERRAICSPSHYATCTCPRR